MKNKNKSLIVSVTVLLFVLAAFVIKTAISNSKADLLENDVEVSLNSPLTYYLDVSYDGVDVKGIASSNTATAEVNSSVITVTDKIPEGLEFKGFVTTADGSIGAVKRSDNTTCFGKVIDDTGTTTGWNQAHTEYVYHGLHYSKETNIVSFKVYNLQAGCYLTVGIITNTPETIDDPNTEEIEKRRDFYNFANARENEFSVNSNTVHAFIGSSDLETFTVSYEYTGDVPEGAPSIPLSSNFVKGANVGVASPVSLTGYTFSGWTTEDVTVTDGNFTMPEKNVVFRGSFTEDTKYDVEYIINGTLPDGYVVPTTKSYAKDTVVAVDSLYEGDIFNGYRFLGWDSEDVVININGEFSMPEKNVTIKGKFEEVKYKVTYKFYNTVLPPNSDSLLPAEKSYKPGTTVSLETVPEVSGYKFLGWYHEDEFAMPEEDITIYGEWKREPGTFEPTINATVDGTKTFFEPKDIITYNVVITNTAAYPIKDVFVKSDLNDSEFTPSANYDLSASNLAVIDEIASGANVTLKVTYKVKTTDSNKITNSISIASAIADNDYTLKEGNYTKVVESNLKSKLEICKTITGIYKDNSFDIKISNSSFETWLNLKKDECKYIYIEPGNYNIKEVLPEEYEIKSITGISANNGELNITQGNNYTVTFENTFKKKGFFHSYGKAKNIIEGGN